MSKHHKSKTFDKNKRGEQALTHGERKFLLWETLSKDYFLHEEQELSLFLREEVKLTYSYLIDFVEFYKNYGNDPNFCLTAIPKDFNPEWAKQDINLCFSKRIADKADKKNFILPYVGHFFANENLSSYGEEYRDVYFFLFPNEISQMIRFIQRFNKLQVFK